MRAHVCVAHLRQFAVCAARRAQHPTDCLDATQQTAAHHLILRALHSIIERFLVQMAATATTHTHRHTDRQTATRRSDRRRDEACAHCASACTSAVAPSSVFGLGVPRIIVHHSAVHAVCERVSVRVVDDPEGQRGADEHQREFLSVDGSALGCEQSSV